MTGVLTTGTFKEAQSRGEMTGEWTGTRSHAKLRRGAWPRKVLSGPQKDPAVLTSWPLASNLWPKTTQSWGWLAHAICSNQWTDATWEWCGHLPVRKQHGRLLSCFGKVRCVLQSKKWYSKCNSSILINRWRSFGNERWFSMHPKPWIY